MIIYRCKSCGEELYRFERVGQDFHGVRTPSEIISMYGGKCPNCGHLLEVPGLLDIKISLRRKGGRRHDIHNSVC